MNGLAAYREPLIIVLDDLHSVSEPECLAAIDYALERLPANARMVAIARADPALRLAQLRAGGKLKEVRASELAFTVAETRELLVEHARVELGEEEIALLTERTEGWPAALVLAGLWLRSVDDPDRAVREFGGTHRFVAEYLSNEVFASLEDDLGSFLQEIAVLGRFTAELCADVLDRSDAASLLAQLEHSNLFLQRLERGGWFRVHSLVAEFAVARLASVEPGAARRIHEKAAAWYRSRGLAVEAIEHAAAAGDHETVAELLDEYHLLLIRSGATRTLLRWIRTLPDDQVATHPELAVAAATAAMLVGHSTIEQRRFLHLAETALATSPSVYADVAVHMVRAVTIDAGVGQAVLDGRHAVELAREGADELLTAALTGYARALYFANDLDEAWEAALRVLEHPDAERRAPSHAVARSTLALVAVERGLLTAARGHAEKAKAIVGGNRHEPKLARRERGRLARRRAGERGQARGRRARAHLRGALLQRRGGDRPPRLGARPARPRPWAAWSSGRGRSDDARGPRGARRARGRRAAAHARRRRRGRARDREGSRGERGTARIHRPRPSSRCSGCWPPI